jgi:hypothetical protein
MPEGVDVMLRKLTCLMLILGGLCCVNSVSAGMVAWYPFENSLLDVSGHGKTAAPNGTVGYADNTANGTRCLSLAYSGDQTADYISCPSEIGSSPVMTVSFVMKPTVDKTSWLINKLATDPVSGKVGWGVKVNATPSRNVAFRVNHGAGQTIVQTSAAWVLGEYQHYTCTVDATGRMRIYRNGQLDVEQQGSPMTANTASLLAIGSFPDPADDFAGDIDDVAVWNRVLDAAEVMELHTEGVPWPMAVAPGDPRVLSVPQGGAAPAPVTYTIFNDDGGHSHTITVAEVNESGTPNDYPWLTLSAGQIVLPAASQNTVDVTINPAPGGIPLSPGVYTAHLKFADDSTPAAQLITRQIELTILGCQFSVSPTAATRSYVVDSGGPVEAAEFTVTNTGKDGLQYAVQEVVDRSWLSLNKSGGGPLNYGTTDQVTAAINPSGLAVGEYTCDVRFTNNCNPPDEAIRTVKLRILPVTPDLAAWYRFEGDTTDSSDNGHNGSPAGDPAYGTGQRGQAIDLDGDGDYVTCGTDPGSSSRLTVAFWMYARQDKESWILNKFGATQGWGAKLTPSSSPTEPRRLTFSYRDASGVRRNVASPNNAWTVNQWQFWTCTIDSSGLSRLYRNGIVVAEATNPPMASSTAVPLVVGTQISPADDFNGLLDEVAVWEGAMDPDQVMDLYLNGVPWPIMVSPGGKTLLTMLEGGVVPGPVTYTLTNDDGGGSHTVAIAEVDGNGNPTDYPWLSLSANQVILAASTDTSIHAAINASPGGVPLAPGVYTAYLKFSDDSVPAHQVVREIELTLLGCQFDVSPASVTRVRFFGSTEPVDDVLLTVTNTGKNGLQYTVQEVVDRPWLSLSKSGGGPLNYGATDQVTAAINPSGLALGEYTCNLRFTNNCSPPDVEIRTVTLKIEASVPIPNLVAYYPFEDTLNDWSGHNYHATALGSIGFDANTSNGSRALSLTHPTDGVVDEASCPIAVGTSPVMTISFMMKPSVDKASWIISKVGRGPANEFVGWGVKLYDATSGHKLAFYVAWGKGRTYMASTSVWTVGEWQHYACTLDAAGYAAIYRNGEFEKGQADVGPMSPNTLRDLSIGSFNNASPTDDYGGLIDEVSLWDRVLTADEIRNLYLFGFPKGVWADADGDDDVDQIDFAAFQRCYGGLVDPTHCLRFDRGRDGDVDELDFLKFLDCGTGPGIPTASANLPAGCF